MNIPLPIRVTLKAFEVEPTYYVACLQVPETATVEEILGIIYRQLNRVDGTEWIADKHYRSLSVADEVFFGFCGLYASYRVEPFGWSIRVAGTQEWKLLE